MKAFDQSVPVPTEADELKKWFSSSLAERLEREAQTEERIATHFKGCSFSGEWPGSHHLRRAALFREAALVLKK